MIRDLAFWVVGALSGTHASWVKSLCESLERGGALLVASVSENVGVDITVRIVGAGLRVDA